MYSACLMRKTRTVMRVALSLAAVTLVLAMLGFNGSASGHTPCSQVRVVYGIPPWGFHTGPFTEGKSFAKGHGKIDLNAKTVSGVICQQDRAGTIIMTVRHHLRYHSHYAMKWGYPGNIMKIKVRVLRSTDPKCAVGTVGRVTIYGSYNGVRSDSSQVNVQVPPPCVAPRPACVASRGGSGSR
jgi:hypothetical protein